MDYLIGKNVFIRTVTHYYTGKLEKIEDGFATLSTAAWVADTGRFADALKNGTLSEVEPFPGPVSVGLGAVIDASEWTHPLPTEQR